jgi:hypothetical protein
MFSKVLRGVFVVDLAPPALEDGEYATKEGSVTMVSGMHGSRFGRLILTNRRVMWEEATRVWPLKRISGELRLNQIALAEKANLLSALRGGRLRLRLMNGRTKHFIVDDTDDWVTAFQTVLAQ